VEEKAKGNLDMHVRIATDQSPKASLNFELCGTANMRQAKQLCE
jgi:hypothetical protein